MHLGQHTLVAQKRDVQITKKRQIVNDFMRGRVIADVDDKKLSRCLARLSERDRLALSCKWFLILGLPGFPDPMVAWAPFRVPGPHGSRIHHGDIVKIWNIICSAGLPPKQDIASLLDRFLAIRMQVIRHSFPDVHPVHVHVYESNDFSHKYVCSPRNLLATRPVAVAPMAVGTKFQWRGKRERERERERVRE